MSPLNYFQLPTKVFFGFLDSDWVLAITQGSVLFKYVFEKFRLVNLSSRTEAHLGDGATRKDKGKIKLKNYNGNMQLLQPHSEIFCFFAEKYLFIFFHWTSVWSSSAKELKVKTQIRGCVSKALFGKELSSRPLTFHLCASYILSLPIISAANHPEVPPRRSAGHHKERRCYAEHMERAVSSSAPSVDLKYAGRLVRYPYSIM